MKRLLFLALLLAGCQTTMDRAAETWYPQAEVVCYAENCPACHGRGHVGCRPCRADGQVRCNRCRGGRVRCGRCKGDGSYKGKACSRCGGSGRVVCGTCGGDGRKACDRCSGKGRLHHLRAIKITEPKPEGKDVWPPIPSEDTK